MDQITSVRVAFRIELYAPDGSICGALSRDDIRMAAAPHAGEQIQIGWLPAKYDGHLPGWLTVDHVDHFPRRPWDAADRIDPGATCVVKVHYPLDAPSVELRSAAEDDGWHVWDHSGSAG